MPASVISGDIRAKNGVQGIIALIVVAAANVTNRTGATDIFRHIAPSWVPIVINPDVAAAESRNDKSNPIQGSIAAPTIKLIANACTALTRRAIRWPVYNAVSIQAARQAEPLPPAKSAYKHAVNAPSGATIRPTFVRAASGVIRSKRPLSAVTQVTIAKTKWVPLTASKWERPL